MLVYGSCESLAMQMLYFVSCVHLVAVLHAAFCMNCSLLMLVKDSHNCLVGSHECLLLFTPSCSVSAFIL